jgi:hypothetical protein
MAILPGFGSNNLPEYTQRVPVNAGGIPLNQPPYVDLRRIQNLDSGSRVAAQAEKDLGVYMRPPVPPVEYAESNIKKSTEFTGVAGYNQRNIPLKDSPDDMSQIEYLVANDKNNPKYRMGLRDSLSGTKQNFLNNPSVSPEYPSNMHNMVNNLMYIAKAKLAKKAK